MRSAGRDPVHDRMLPFCTQVLVSCWKPWFPGLLPATEWKILALGELFTLLGLRNGKH